jgi:protein-S-isoprenylcysteine O-methyltransferase Ste14
MPRFGKRYADAVARLRVPGGFLLAGMFAWLADPDMYSIAAGAPLSVIGLLLRAWAAGHLRKNESLATSGPYAWIRNPLYAGTLIVAAGLVVASKRYELALLFTAVFGLVYFPVIELEEQHLHRLFPGFGAYSRSVPMLIPRGRKTGGHQRFRFAHYWRNQEHKAALAYLAGLALLLWKAAD